MNGLLMGFDGPPLMGCGLCWALKTGLMAHCRLGFELGASAPLWTIERSSVNLALTDPPGVGEQFLLEVLRDPFLNDDIVGVILEELVFMNTIAYAHRMLTSSQSQGRLYVIRVSGRRCLRWT
jgi:hypothetical protein